jgi:hypothetical protein
MMGRVNVRKRERGKKERNKKWKEEIREKAKKDRRP